MTTTESLTATAPLTRFALRRDRVRIVVWIAGIVLLVVTTVASVKGLYPNQAELDKAARASEDNAAAIIFNGPAQALDTVGGQVAFQTGSFGLILIGLMSVFMVGRLTRGEEQAGRVELLHALPVGPHSLAAAAVVTVAAMNVVTGALVTLALVALDLAGHGLGGVWALVHVVRLAARRLHAGRGAGEREHTRRVRHRWRRARHLLPAAGDR